VTPATYALLKDDFDFEPHGPIEVKGVGKMETWFLLGNRHIPVGARQEQSTSQ
jgi:hypothetical protein